MIAIIAWGSLIWKPQDLPYDGSWKKGGPTLSLEFSRITDIRPLTVVLDPTHGVACLTRFAISSRTALPDAIEDLKQRESASDEYIGYVDLEHDRSSLQDYPQQLDIEDVMHRWCSDQQISAAIWTALPPNFTEQLGVEFSAESALAYLKDLSKPEQESALEYIQKTPAEVNTPLRRKVVSQWNDS